MAVETQAASPPPLPESASIPKALATYFRFNGWLSKQCLRISVFGLCTILGAVLTQIFGRYVLNDSPTWTEIFALVVVLYVTCLSAAVGVRDSRHIGMESIVIFLGETGRKRIEIFVYLSMIFFGAAMSYGGGILAFEVWDYMNPGLPISQGWSYVPLCGGGLLIAYFAVEQIIARLVNVKVVPSWH
ncbi:TRAP transporter small permease [Telmatospirillum siberiense]|uniref:TRAP transporter small permease protein n=1 Tax=Telmatospirillum siberiense TaxID=382514 RepID=A0A2N3PN41_9PROT|nr:TRAP transporter small permease [Telmatospirillum siberiense]PKU21818.1 C4-dicarboxylate ABC transporter permease [Telmatospirillum siberiense]